MRVRDLFPIKISNKHGYQYDNDGKNEITVVRWNAWIEASMWYLDLLSTPFRFRPIEVRLTMNAEHFVASAVLLDGHLTSGTPSSKPPDPLITLALPL